jgi:hypothetical protein
MTQVDDPQANRSFLRLWLARVAIVFVVFGTTIAVVSILRGELRPAHLRWMFTAFVGAFFLGSAQASTAAWDKRRLAVGKLGQITSIAGFVVFLWGMWFGGFREIVFWKAEISLLLISIAAAHTSLLSVAKLPPPMVWLRAVSVMCGWFVTGSLIFMTLVEWSHPDWMRFLAVLSLLWMSTSFVLGIVHKLDDPDAE